MSNKQKWIITGFAWMLLGIGQNILHAISQFEQSTMDVIFSCVMYGGFIMILLGVFAVVDKPKKRKWNRNQRRLRLPLIFYKSSFLTVVFF